MSLNHILNLNLRLKLEDYEYKILYKSGKPFNRKKLTLQELDHQDTQVLKTKFKTFL